MKKKARTRATRGPVRGAQNAGRPTDAKAAAKKRPPAKKRAAKKKADKRKAATPFVEQLAHCTFSQLKTWAAGWRPLEDQDQMALAMLWECLQRYRTAANDIHSRKPSDWYFITDTGYQQQIPAFALLNTAFGQIIPLAAKFGMTPGDRVRLGDVPEAEPTESKFAAHLAKAGALNAKVQAKNA